MEQVQAKPAQVLRSTALVNSDRGLIMASMTACPAGFDLSTWELAAPGRPSLGQPADLMGVLNCTPDSFSDGGSHADVPAAIAAGQALVAAGAGWLDVGGESSRPGAVSVAVDEECARVVPVIAGLRAAGVGVPISVDTCKAAVAERAIAAGATMVNDIRAGADPEMLPLVAETGVALCLMHMRGEPATMQSDPRYDDVVEEVGNFLDEAMQRAREAGVPAEALVCDPGIGFGKTLAHNLALLQALPELGRRWQRPQLVGISRKRMVDALLGGGTAPRDRDAGSHLLHVQLAPHCALLRVHDVAGARRALRLCLAQREMTQPYLQQRVADTPHVGVRPQPMDRARGLE